MGNNAAYSTFEQITVGVYNALKGQMSKAVMSAILKACGDCDIDSGGKEGLLSFDDLEVEEIVLKVMGVKAPTKPKLPKDYQTWTQEQCDQNERYQERFDAAFNRITRKFNWY